LSKTKGLIRYLFSLTAYIHNNPSDLPGFQINIENYLFSSLGVYLKLRKDYLEILDHNFILSLFGKSNINSKKQYINLVVESRFLIAENEAEFENEPTEYRSERKILIRDFKTDDIIDYIAKTMDINKINLFVKYNKSLVKARALLVLMLRNLCNSSCKEICSIIGNITQSRVSKLCDIGKDLIMYNDQYKNIIHEFIEKCS
jgi:putative transposase